MARISSRGESDPLMRLKRPLSASSVQDTAHIIDSCFGEMLKRRSVDKQAACDQVASQVGGSGGSYYNDHLVDELQKVRKVPNSQLVRA